MISALIYTPQLCSKLDYVLEFVFDMRIGIEYSVITDHVAFLSSMDPIKINYSQKSIDGAVSIKSTCYFSDFKMETVPHFESELSLASGKSNFDLFAAIFFLLARVEEYGTEKVDQHSRYLASASHLSITGLLDIPVIDMWVTRFALHLEKESGLKLEKPNYKVTSTIDVDHIYAYKGKSLIHSVASSVRDAMTLQVSKLKARVGQDPFDTYQEIISANAACGYIPIFFFLTADRDEYDKSLPPSHSLFIEKVREISSSHMVGIHPSYASNSNPDKLSKEIKTLSSITKTPITKSRQHYLKLSLPDTYQSLIANGIQEDYSMGYAETVGYRAGTSRPFFWYDLNQDKMTTLKIVPFCLMDVTLRKHMQLTPIKAVSLIEGQAQILKEVGGHFSFIWHNSSFYAAEGWTGWDKVYKQLLQIARP